MEPTTETPPERHSYTLVLEVKTQSPLTHGSGVEGNEQVLATREVVVEDPEEGWIRESIPCVSGAAMKATLREWAFRDAMERAGVKDGQVSKDALRLLTKGGKNDRGGQSVTVAKARELRDLFPMLSVFGSMDGGLPLRGKVQVSEVMPFCDAAVDAGVVPRKVTRLAVETPDDAPELSVDGEEIPVWPTTEPIPAHLVRTRVQYYRHDMLSGPHTHLLEDGARKAQEDARAARKGKAAKKKERREANESMPYSMQAIAPGVPMVVQIRLQDATEAEWGCLAMAITRWVMAGAPLGGATTKGHGRCQVRVAGALRYSPAAGDVAAEPGTMLELQADDRERALSVARAYDAHVQERAEQIREYVAESTR